MKRLKTAVIGLGRIGWQYHLPSIAKHEGFELAAAVDPLPERLDEARGEYGIRTYKDTRQLYENESLDLVVVASPTLYHAGQAIEAMRLGIDVFADKPLASTLAEADEMIRVMTETGCKLMVYQPLRAERECLALKYILDRGLIGDVYMIKNSHSAYLRRNDWQSLSRYGGGMLNNSGAHIIDLLLYLAGAGASKVAGHMRRIASLGDADDVIKLVMEAANGIILDIDINNASAIPLPKWHVMGSKGTIAYFENEEGYGYFKVVYYKQEELPPLPLHPETAAPGRHYKNFDKIPWKEELIRISDFGEINFYDKCHDYFSSGKDPFVPVAQTREVMRVIDECRSYSGFKPNI